jgi:hypothetical protein
MNMERRTILTVLFLTALVGCSTSTKPDGSIPAQEEPFYYSGGRKVYLGLDSSRVTVSTSLPMPDSALSVLGTIGVGVDSVTTLWKADHYVIWFSRGTSWKEASEAALALRLTRGFDFASNAYISPFGGGLFVLVDEFFVRFEEGTEPRKIDKLNQRMGTHVTSRYGPDSLYAILSYPVNSTATPLEVVAYFYRHPIVANARPWLSVETLR